MDTRLELSLPQEGDRFIMLWLEWGEPPQYSTTLSIKKPGMFGVSWGERMVVV